MNAMYRTARIPNEEVSVPVKHTQNGFFRLTKISSREIQKHAFYYSRLSR